MFLDIEQGIIALLQPAVPAPAKVMRAADLAGIDEQAQFTPAVHVIYAGYRPTRDLGGGTIAEIETRWFIVIAVRNARGNVDTHEDAEPLLTAAFTALAGQKPTQDARPLTLSGGPQPSYNAGFAYYPLVFTTRQTLRGTAH